MAVRVYFANFWPGAFSAANSACFLLYALNEAFGSTERVSDATSADLIVSSVFGDEPTSARKTIQYIGENVRPNLGYCRYALSFDYDAYGGRNFRLPLWWWRLEWPGFGEYWRQRPAPKTGNPHGHEDLIPIDALLRPRSVPARELRFCVLIASNPEPLRSNLFIALQTLGQVAGYGHMFHNPLTASKFEVLPGFRFCLCAESGIYPGYHTEKLLDAWYGGCVPLYSGDRLLGRDFNPGALVNYQDYLDTPRFLAEVKRLEEDARAFAEIHSQPLLLQRPSLSGLIAFLRSALTEIQRDAR